MLSFCILTLLSSLLTSVTSSPIQSRDNVTWSLVQPEKIGAPNGPVISKDFPDPSITRIKEDGRDVWYSFGTSSGGINIQVARSTDFRQWTVVSENGKQKDALPQLGDWTTVDGSGNPMVWAPDVARLDDGTYVLYYSALGTAHLHCIAHATSSQITGPYKAAAEPLVCDFDRGGAIDASGFRDADKQRYISYKIDGNAIGSGGNCGNGDGAKSTPIMLQAVEKDGVTFKGDPVQLLDRDEADGPLVEAPSLIRLDDGRHALFFSSNCYTSPMYDVSYAISDNGVRGPYKKSAEPLLVTGMYGLTAPGGASLYNVPKEDGYKMVFHADSDAGRSMWTANVDVDGIKISIF